MHAVLYPFCGLHLICATPASIQKKKRKDAVVVLKIGRGVFHSTSRFFFPEKIRWFVVVVILQKKRGVLFCCSF